MTPYTFAKRTLDIPENSIRFMMWYASRHKDVVSLGQGTPLFETPSFIYDYVRERAAKDPRVGMYANAEYELELKNHISSFMNKEYGFAASEYELQLTVGGVAGLFAAFMTFLEPGDEVVYFHPSYPLQLSQLHLNGAKPVFVALDEKKNWGFDPEAFLAAITPKTKLVILTNPNNPTGTVFSEKDIRIIADAVLKNNLMLVLDEAYAYLTYDKPLFSPLRIPELRPRIILSRSFSKEFAMTGWRIGFLYADREVIRKLRDVHFYYSISVPTPSLIGAIGALTDPRGAEATAGFVKQFAESRKLIGERIARLPRLFSYQPPDGAFYAFPRMVDTHETARQLALRLVDEAKVITIPGESMGPGGRHHLRMSFAAPLPHIDKAFDRIDDFARKNGYLS